jgi:hypothetical protein
MIPYLDDEQTHGLIQRLVPRLAQGGILAFLEQDLLTNSLSYPSSDLLRRVVAKEQRVLKQTLALGLHPLLREAGLELLPRQSFLWTDETYGPYTRELFQRLSEDALEKKRISEEERVTFLGTLDQLATSGRFYYGLVYHLISGKL